MDARYYTFYEQNFLLRPGKGNWQLFMGAHDGARYLGTVYDSKGLARFFGERTPGFNFPREPFSLAAPSLDALVAMVAEHFVLADAERRLTMKQPKRRRA